MAAAEMAPVCRVGGLADATTGLATTLARLGCEVIVAIPRHERWPSLEGPNTLSLDVEPWAGPAVARFGQLEDRLSVAVIDTPGMERPHPYNDPRTGLGWEDNDERFLSFSNAAASLAVELEVDVVHLHDWHAAAATAWLAGRVPTVLSIHNLVYQGQAARSWLDRLGEHSIAFEVDGRTNPLAGGIRLADRIVAVSPAYALETRRAADGAGLDGVLRDRGPAYLGIRNGIDVERWDPAIDPHLPVQYDALHVDGKAYVRRALCDLAGFEPHDEPVVGMVCRLVDQKGVDVALEVAQQLRGLGARLVIQGRGDPALEAAARQAAATDERLAFLETTDEETAHLVVAGSDLLLVPSRFEPCGLTPMEAMRCGTIPVVTPVGGLRDTVVDASADPVRGNGFIAPAADAVGVSLALSRAVRALGDPIRHAAIRRNGMITDWSWRTPALAYLDIYEELASDSSAASLEDMTDDTRSRISGRAFEGAPAS
jgi:starch synthase